MGELKKTGEPDVLFSPISPI